MLEFLRNKKIMIVVAHPDDEVLGLGGTMNKLIKEFNIKSKVLILGEGITSRGKDRDLTLWKQELINHKRNILDSGKKIGYNNIKTYDLPDNRFDTVPLLDIIKIIETEKKEFKPEVIFTHHGGDLNIDHRLVFESVITSSRPVKNEITKAIITFETPSGTEWIPSSKENNFRPNFFVSLDLDNIKSKIKAIESYEYEKRDYPHPRSSKALLNLSERWGIVNGVNYAEAFQIIRINL